MGESNDNSNWYEPLITFFLEVLVGTFIFFLVLLPAVGINFFIKWLAEKGVDPILIYGLTGLEYTIFTVDVALCIFFIAKSAIKAGKKL